MSLQAKKGIIRLNEMILHSFFTKN